MPPRQQKIIATPEQPKVNTSLTPSRARKKQNPRAQKKQDKDKKEGGALNVPRIPVSTMAGSEYPNQRVLGCVRGTAVKGTNVVKDFLSGFQDFFGGKMTQYEKDWDTALDRAIDRMRQQAGSMYPNCNYITSMKHSICTVNENAAVVTVVGTAVVIPSSGFSF